MDASALARLIDHTALKPSTSRDGVLRLCREATTYGFGAVCVAPAWVALAAEALAGTAVRVASVVGFPHGDTLTEVKELEAKAVRRRGADEVDVVLHVGALKSGDRSRVEEDLRAVVAAAGRPAGGVVKVIVEAPLLTHAEKLEACRIAARAGADYVKTSTGFGGNAATVEDVRLLAEAVAPDLGVKAAGGIRSLADALAMVEAGATRIGCSASVSIVREARDPA